jgi:hypothetical protein
LQIPAAWLASKFGFKRVYGLSMLLAGVLTLLFPLAARQAVTAGPRGPNFLPHNSEKPDKKITLLDRGQHFISKNCGEEKKVDK